MRGNAIRQFQKGLEPCQPGFAELGEVLELADRRDLGSRAERREGSSPSFPTTTGTGI
jgi:hypothetical protein